MAGKLFIGSSCGLDAAHGEPDPQGNNPSGRRWWGGGNLLPGRGWLAEDYGGGGDLLPGRGWLAEDYGGGGNLLPGRGWLAVDYGGGGDLLPGRGWLAEEPQAGAAGRRVDMGYRETGGGASAPVPRSRYSRMRQ